jgi:broad specificity phosphatase PhoE
MTRTQPAPDFAAVQQWIADNLREVDEPYEPWYAPIVEAMESGETWREVAERARAKVARVEALCDDAEAHSDPPSVVAVDDIRDAFAD